MGKRYRGDRHGYPYTLAGLLQVCVVPVSPGVFEQLRRQISQISDLEKANKQMLWWYHGSLQAFKNMSPKTN
jgi:hypothetical protein